MKEERAILEEFQLIGMQFIPTGSEDNRLEEPTGSSSIGVSSDTREIGNKPRHMRESVGHHCCRIVLPTSIEKLIEKATSFSVDTKRRVFLPLDTF